MCVPLATCFLLPDTVESMHIFNPFFYLLLHLTNFLAWAIPHHVMKSNFLLTHPQLHGLQAAANGQFALLYKIPGPSSISVAQLQHNLVCVQAVMSPCKDGDQAEFQELRS